MTGIAFSRTDSEFLRERLLTAGIGKVILVVNKWDAIQEGPSADVRQYVRVELQRLLDQLQSQEDPGTARFAEIMSVADVYPVSGQLALYARSRGGAGGEDVQFHWNRLSRRYALGPLDALRAGDTGVAEQAEAASGILDLERGLDRFLMANRGVMLLTGPLDKAHAALRQSRRESESALSRLEEQSGDLDRATADLQSSLQRIEAERAAVVRGLDRIDDHLAKTRAEVGQSLGAALDRTLERRVEDLRKAYGERIDAFGAVELAWSRAPVRTLNSDLKWAIRGVDKDIKDEVAGAFARLQERARGDLAEALRTQAPGARFSVDVELATVRINDAVFVPAETPFREIEDMVGLWDSLKTLGAPADARSLLKEALQDRLNELGTQWGGHSKDIRRAFEAAPASACGAITARVRAQFADRVGDLESAIDRSRCDLPAREADRGRIDGEIATLRRGQEAARHLLSKVESLRTNVSSSN